VVHYEHANGIGDDTLDLSHNTPKSIGSSETFLNDTDDFDEIKGKLIELTRDSFNRLQRHELQCKTLNVSIKTPDFKLHTKSLTLTKYINDFEQILLKIITLYQNNFADKTIRLVGVSFSNLFDNRQVEFTNELFDDYYKSPDKQETSNAMDEIIQKINHKFAKNIIDTAKNKIS
jgi:DNA polymerase-4